jgi:hypothetical protein
MHLVEFISKHTYTNEWYMCAEENERKEFCCCAHSSRKIARLNLGSALQYIKIERILCQRNKINCL